VSRNNLVANINTYIKVRNTIRVVTVCFQGKNLKDARDNAKRVDLLERPSHRSCGTGAPTCSCSPAGSFSLRPNSEISRTKPANGSWSRRSSP
jgi:hypothetical protein